MIIFRDNAVLPRPGHVRNLSRIWETLLCMSSSRNIYKKGSYFSHEDSKANIFSYIKTGRTCTVRMSDDGQEHIKLFIDEGCLFNEVYVIAGCCSSFPLHRCLTDVEMFHFNGDLLTDQEFTYNHRKHIDNLLWGISMKTLAQDMIRDIIAQKTVGSKIANWILLSSNSKKKMSFSPLITQIELSMMLHTHKSSINRAILSMQKMGIIGTFNRKLCEIHDLAKLNQIATGDVII